MKKFILFIPFLLASGQMATAQCSSAPVPYQVTADNTAAPGLPECLSSNYATFASTEVFNTIQGPIPGFTGNVLGYNTVLLPTEWNTNPEGSVGVSLATQRVQMVQGLYYRVSFRYGVSNPANTINNLSVTAAALGANVANIATLENITGAPQNFVSEPFTPGITGIYYLSFEVFTDGNQGFFYLDDILVEQVQAPVGSVGRQDIDFVSAYPNPATDIITLNGTVQLDRVTLFAATGQKALSQEVNNTTARINVQALAAGIYMLNVEADGRRQNLKIVKE